LGVVNGTLSFWVYGLGENGTLGVPSSILVSNASTPILGITENGSFVLRGSSGVVVFPLANVTITPGPTWVLVILAFTLSSNITNPTERNFSLSVGGVHCGYVVAAGIADIAGFGASALNVAAFRRIDEILFVQQVVPSSVNLTQILTPTPQCVALGVVPVGGNAVRLTVEQDCSETTFTATVSETYDVLQTYGVTGDVLFAVYPSKAVKSISRGTLAVMNGFALLTPNNETAGIKVILNSGMRFTSVWKDAETGLLSALPSGFILNADLSNLAQNSDLFSFDHVVDKNSCIKVYTSEMILGLMIIFVGSLVIISLIVFMRTKLRMKTFFPVSYKNLENGF
jgi:hypothetical protein